ncbi:MAG: TadE/TadG family type IV pilus assembly protein [Bryobacteraceae bacterium]
MFVSESKNPAIFAGSHSIIRPGPLRRNTGSGRKGNTLIEFALVAGVLFVLLLVVLNLGLYSYAFISVQNAARVAAARNAGGLESAVDQAAACAMTIEELRGLPNLGSSFSSSCTAAPLRVSSVLCSGSAACGGSPASADGAPAALVTISYDVPAAFQLPMLSVTQITRTAQMKIRSIP